MAENRRNVQHACAVGVMALGLAATMLAGISVRGLQLDARDIFVIMTVLAYIAGLASLLFKVGQARLASGLLSVTVLFAIILTALLSTALLATNDRPLADPLFAAADSVIAPWLNWYDLSRWLSQHRTISRAGEWVYHSLEWQPFFLLCALCWNNKPQDAWSFIGMWTFSLMICEIVFATYPGVGAYAYHGIDAALASPTSGAVSAGQLQLLTRLRNPALTTIDIHCIGSMITFPSFHAVAAVLLSRGYWRMQLLRWPFLLLNFAMLATSIPMGGHYVVDLVAGLVVAALAITIFDSPALRWDPTLRPISGGCLPRAPQRSC